MAGTALRNLDEEVVADRARQDRFRARASRAQGVEAVRHRLGRSVPAMHAPVAAGTVVAVLIRHLGFWSLNGCRVVYSVGGFDGEARFGFAYGTLTNHAESGEELFEVFLDPQTEDVMYQNPCDLVAAEPRWRDSASRSCACFKRDSVDDSAAAMRRATRADSVRAMSIYVEILVRAPMDALWAHTQTPALHERWDLRFSRIEYLPKAHESEASAISLYDTDRFRCRGERRRRNRWTTGCGGR